MNNQKVNESEGEIYLENFFNELGIKFEREKQISGLKSDARQYRVADFYLPKYKVYVEFFGLWNKQIKDDDYRLKKEVYRLNGVPCVYVYPENLGIIKFSFDKRLQETLRVHNMKKELTKYRMFKLLKSDRFQDSSALFGLSMFAFIYYFITHVNSKMTELKDFALFSCISLSIAIYQVYKFYRLYQDIFKHNRFSLEKLKS